MALLKWLPHYFLPWNLLFALRPSPIGASSMPDVETMKTLQLGLGAVAVRRQCVAVFLFYGAFELRLYVLRARATASSTTAKFPSEQKSKAFWFKSQNIDNILRTFFTGVPIWTAHRGRRSSGPSPMAMRRG